MCGERAEDDGQDRVEIVDVRICSKVLEHGVCEGRAGVDQASYDRAWVTVGRSVDFSVGAEARDKQVNDLVVGEAGEAVDDGLDELQSLGLHRFKAVATVANEAAPAVVDRQRQKRLDSVREGLHCPDRGVMGGSVAVVLVPVQGIPDADQHRGIQAARGSDSAKPLDGLEESRRPRLPLAARHLAPKEACRVAQRRLQELRGCSRTPKVG